MKVNLCCDCLAINPYRVNSCSKCGGDSCWCDSCQSTAKMLLDGERDYRKLDLKSPITSWNPESGLLESHEDGKKKVVDFNADIQNMMNDYLEWEFSLHKNKIQKSIDRKVQ